MQLINKRNIRAWSSLGQKGTVFGVALPEIAKNNDNLYVVTADLMRLSGLSRFKNMYPNKLINVGIAEQNMIGFACGLAFEGNNVYATSYASFLTMRCYEQIRHNLGYQNANVKLIGSSSGLITGFSGNTHYSIEDIGIMRLIPNIIILSPCDCVEAYKMTHLINEINAPVYMRLSGALNNPVVYNQDYDLKIGKAITLREGKDLVIFTNGSMVSEAQKLCEKLEIDNISAKLINIHTISPLDKDVIDDNIEAKLFVTIEEHRVIGGLYSCISEYLISKKTKPLHIPIAIQDNYLKVGDYEYLKKITKLNYEDMYIKIKEILKNI